MLRTKHARTAGYSQLQKLALPNGDNLFKNGITKNSKTGKTTAGGRSSGGARRSASLDARDVGRLSDSDRPRSRPATGASVRDSGPASLTPGERKAYRVGYLEGIADSSAQLDARRIRIAAKSLDIDVPEFWPERAR